MSKITRSKHISKLFILALVLFVPGFLYIMVNKMGSNSYVKLPVFGEKKLSGKMNRVMGREIPDTLFHELSPITFQDYNDKPVNFLGSDTIITVAHLFYTKDKGLSKQLIQDISNIANRFKSNGIVRLYSIDVDSTDTNEAMKSFTQNDKGDQFPNWFIVNRPDVDIFNYARSSMLIEAMPVVGDPDKFIISNQLILIDSKRRIRGFYDISLRSELDRLEDEIKVQIVEEVRNRPSKVEKK